MTQNRRSTDSRYATNQQTKANSYNERCSQTSASVGSKENLKKKLVAQIIDYKQTSSAGNIDIGGDSVPYTREELMNKNVSKLSDILSGLNAELALTPKFDEEDRRLAALCDEYRQKVIKWENQSKNNDSANSDDSDVSPVDLTGFEDGSDTLDRKMLELVEEMSGE